MPRSVFIIPVHLDRFCFSSFILFCVSLHLCTCLNENQIRFQGSEDEPEPKLIEQDDAIYESNQSTRSRRFRIPGTLSADIDDPKYAGNVVKRKELDFDDMSDDGGLSSDRGVGEYERKSAGKSNAGFGNFSDDADLPSDSGTATAKKKTSVKSNISGNSNVSSSEDGDKESKDDLSEDDFDDESEGEMEVDEKSQQKVSPRKSLKHFDSVDTAADVRKGKAIRLQYSELQ